MPTLFVLLKLGSPTAPNHAPHRTRSSRAGGRIGHGTLDIRTIKMGVRRKQHADIISAIVMAVLAVFVVSCAHPNPSAATKVTRETLRVQLPAGTAGVDVYWPSAATQVPMVIVAHGFSRCRHNMSGWGQHLAQEGFVAVVPDLPTRSDHARNGRFLSELRAYLLGDESWREHIDPARVGLLGFSAGGLSSLLSAAHSPGLAIWVGLDPVDRYGLGVKAATMVQSRAAVLTAEPSACNAHGNARDMISALPRHEHFRVAGAVHVDAEWPTSWLAELVCGRSTDERRAEFQARATQALKEAFALQPAGEPSRQRSFSTRIAEHSGPCDLRATQSLAYRCGSPGFRRRVIP
jgi:acetyl esterase/lipase